jgi:hypothetical protein
VEKDKALEISMDSTLSLGPDPVGIYSAIAVALAVRNLVLTRGKTEGVFKFEGSIRLTGPKVDECFLRSLTVEPEEVQEACAGS